MKLKKAYIYLLSFMSLAFLFSVCYFFSYQHALRNFNRRAVERDRDYSFVEIPQPTGIQPEDNQELPVDMTPVNTILPETKYIIETYHIEDERVETEQLNPPADLVGLNREEVEEYLLHYMANLPLSEYSRGLVSFDLLTFSDTEVKVRKSYDESKVLYRFCVAVKNGFVIVYNSDLKSVYQYTHIEAKYLSESDRIALSVGIYIKDEKELYSLLESYSS